MEWKSYYGDELRRTDSRDRITRWLQLAQDQPSPSLPVDRRSILSFPHTALGYSGPLQARVVAWLLDQGFRRVILLGVMHGSLVPEYRLATDATVPIDERQAAIAAVTGGFVPAARALETPFGSLPVETLPIDTSPDVRLDTRELLRSEFSLDTFCAILRLAADVFQVSLPSVLPIYVGMARHPIARTFDMAASLGDWLREQWEPSTAIVATGDVVHYGAYYGSSNEGSRVETLARLFRQRLDDLFVAAFDDSDPESAYQISLRDLKSDQRELLPVIARLLGDGAVASVESFELSDYAGILDASPPCLVASALIAYKNRSAWHSDNQVFA